MILTTKAQNVEVESFTNGPGTLPDTQKCIHLY